MTVSELARRTGITIAEGSGEKEAVGCYCGDLLSHVMARCPRGSVWLTVHTDVNAVAVALHRGCAGLVICEGMPSPEQREAARREGVCLLYCGLDEYALAIRIGGALAEEDL